MTWSIADDKNIYVHSDMLNTKEITISHHYITQIKKMDEFHLATECISIAPILPLLLVITQLAPIMHEF